jgi:pimeloyl-ACP methyl ester carboxylesterase
MWLSVDQARVFAATGGRPFDPGRPCIVFVHGAGMDHSVWAQQTRYFAHHGFAVLAPDLPGHGRSEAPPLESVTALATWVSRVFDAAGAGTAALVGHSMGALVALESASQVPERITALALLAISFPMAVHDGLLASAAANEHRALDLINNWAHSHGAQIGRNAVPGLWLTGGSIRLLEAAADGVVYTDLKAVKNYDRGFDAAAKVRCATLLVLGEHDRMTPPKGAHALAERMAGHKTVVIPACGHMVMTEQPDRVRGELLAHLRALVTVP